MASTWLLTNSATSGITGTTLPGVTNYTGLQGWRAKTTTETLVQMLIRDTYTGSNLWVRSAVNGSDGVTTIRTRKNAGDGAQSVTFAAATTGVAEDTVNTDAMATGELWNYSFTNAGGVGNFSQTITSILLQHAGTGTFPLGSTVTTAETQADSLTRYFAISGRLDNADTEINTQYTFRVAATLRNLRIWVSSNTTTATARTRKDAGDGAQSAAIGANLTGSFEDVTNSDTVTAGEEWNYAVVTTSDMGTIGYSVLQVECEAVGNPIVSNESGNGTGVGNAAVVYWPLGGTLAGTLETTETPTQLDARTSLTIANMFAYVSANTRAANTVVTFRKNGAAAGPTVTFGSSVTGVQEDTVNTVTVADGDLINYSVDGTAAAGTTTFRVLGVESQQASSAQTLTPSPIDIPISLPSVSVSITQTITPSPIAVPIVLPTQSLALSLSITPDPIQIPLALPSVSVAASLTLTPDPIAVPILLPSVSVAVTQVIAPDPIAIPISLPDPTVSLGALTLTPDPVQIPIVLPDPTLTLALTLTPDPVSIPIVLPDPTLSLTLSITPDPIVIPVILPDPVVILGALTLTPDPVVVPILLPDVSIAAIQTLTPDPVVIPIILTDPVVAASLSLAPDPIQVLIVLPDPAISLGALTISPDPIAVPIVLPTPAIATTLVLTPDPIQIPVVLPAPSISTSLSLSPDPIVIPIVLPTPSLTASLTLAPDPLPIPIQLPDPTVSQTGAQTLTPTAITIPILLPSVSVSVTPVPPVPPAPSTGDSAYTPSGGWARVLASIRNPLPLNWWQRQPWRVQPRVQPVELQVLVYRHQVVSHSGLSPQSHVQQPATSVYPAAIKAQLTPGAKSAVQSPLLSITVPTLHTKAVSPASILQPPTASLSSPSLIVWTEKQYRDDLDDLVALGIIDPDDRDRELLELIGRR